MTVVLGVLLAASACGGTPRKVNRGDGQVRGIAAAKLPFRIVRVDGGRQIAMDELISELASARAVCIGETHTNPHDHWAQLELFDRLSAQNEGNRISTALGMEMFQRPFQGVLDDFAAGKIDDKALLSLAGWNQRWGYDWNLYRPIVHLARDRGASIIALNISTELKVKVRENGVDQLSPEDKQNVPELDLENEGHRAWWSSLMKEMGGADAHTTQKKHDSEADHESDQDQEKTPAEQPDTPAGEDPEDGEPPAGSDDTAAEGEPAEKPKEAVDEAERMYMIQVLWDETMAETAAGWVRGGINRQIIILAGNGHCHDSAIVARVRRRGVEKVVSIRPVIDKADGEVAGLLAAPENDFLFVMEMPSH